jgi:hypothetical protein
VKNMVRQLDAMTFRVSIGSGIIAVSPLVYSHPKKITSPTADPQKSPITMALSHLYVLPPHSRARRNMIAVGAKKMKPIGSSDLIVDRKEGLTSVWAVWVGIRMERRKSATSPPAGRLI